MSHALPPRQLPAPRMAEPIGAIFVLRACVGTLFRHDESLAYATDPCNFFTSAPGRGAQDESRSKDGLVSFELFARFFYCTWRRGNYSTPESRVAGSFSRDSYDPHTGGGGGSLNGPPGLALGHFLRCRDYDLCRFLTPAASRIAIGIRALVFVLRVWPRSTEVCNSRIPFAVFSSLPYNESQNNS